MLQSLSGAQLVEILIASLGAVGTIAAAVAGWRAATAARNAVGEMREARLQTMRPAIDVHIPDDAQLLFEADGEVRLFAVEKNDPEPRATITVISQVPVIRLEAEWLSCPRQRADMLEGSGLPELLALGGFELLGPSEDYRNLFSHASPGSGGCGVAFDALSTQPLRASTLPPDAKIQKSFGANSFYVAALDFLSRKLSCERDGVAFEAHSEALTVFDVLQVKYRSLSGENFERFFAIMLRPWFSQLSGPDGTFEVRSLAGQWQELSVRFRLELMEIESIYRKKRRDLGYFSDRPPLATRGMRAAMAMMKKCRVDISVLEG